ncbi:hypothetical protein PUY80_08390 [Plantibacter flavus]|uniref:HEPN domain-containing protein n=1 Tax=Plantibacter flavus TaxID=150123 RepID=UPI002379164E|nr:HEPN domain-containing protein [Plantibacter flavus]MDD9152592.1 hypothetical protein [Plantibacter flavus]
MIVGDWWPADAPELRFSGVLTTTDGKASLTVTAPPIGQEVNALGRAMTLHGEAKDPSGVTRITLWGAEGTHFHHETATELTRSVAQVVLGAHFGGAQGERFRSSAASFHDLAMWSRVPDPISDGTAESEARQHTVAVMADVYADIFGAGYAVEVRLEYPTRIQTNETFPDGIISDFPGDHVRVVFDVSPPASLEFHDLLLRDMQALLTFSYLSGAPVTGQWIGSDPGNLYALIRRDTFRDRAFARRGGFQMILTTEVAPFGHLVQEWWNLLDEHFPAPQVLTMYLHTSRGLLEQSTASVLAATEHLHTQIGETQTRLEPRYLACRSTEILGTYEGDEHAAFRQFMREKLRENRPTLQTRLEQLVNIVGVEQVSLTGIDSEAWIRLFKSVRNKLAHTGAHVPRRGDSSDDLELINAQTRSLLAMLLLSRMNLTVESLTRAANTLGKWPHNRLISSTPPREPRATPRG